MDNSEGQWYILNTLTQHEKGVRENIQRQINLNDPSIPVFEVQYPMEKVMEVKNGVRRPTERKYFPGYVFVRMKLYDEDNKVIESVWHYIHGIKGVSKIGGTMTQDEVKQWISNGTAEEEAPQQAPRLQYNVGDHVEIVDGPFTGFKGVVLEIDAERGFLKVEIMVFARPTPMELEFWQVEKSVD